MDFFHALLEKVGFSLGGRALACTLCFWGLPRGLALAIGCFARVLITEEEVSEILGPLRMMPTGSDSGANSESGSWKKYLHLSSDSEGQGQGPEHSEAEPASRKRGGTDPREDVGPSSVRRRVDSANAPGTENLGGPSQQPTSSNFISGPGDVSLIENPIFQVFFYIKGRKPGSNVVTKLINDLSLSEASPEKKFQILKILEDMKCNADSFKKVNWL